MTNASEKLRINKNDNQIKSIFKNTHEGKKKVIAWMIIGKRKVTADTSLKIVRESRKELVIEPLKKAEETFSEISGSSDKINFYIPKEKVLFQSKIKSIEKDGRVIIEMPTMITQVERRNHLRLFIDEEISTNLKFTKTKIGPRSLSQTFDKKCFDLSAGGASLILTRAEGKLFNSGEIISKATLSVEGKEITTDLKVITITKIEPNVDNELFYTGFKIGFSFEAIRKDDQEWLEKLVFTFIDLDEALGF